MPDITPPTNDLVLGSKWGPAESYRGEVFRWVANDAVLYVATMKQVDHRVQLQIEPGPGVGLKPFELQVIEGAQVIAKLEVKGRQGVSFDLPAAEPTVHKLVLHTGEGGKTAPNDPRVLNFRVFKIIVQRLPGDVLPAGSGFKLGTGWYPLETFSGQSFRWVNNDATIEASTAASPKLRLEVEPGPGLEMKPFVLQVLDKAGAAISSIDVKSRQFIEIELPKSLKLPTNLRLHVEGGGKMSSGDSRIMNFRLLEFDPDREPAAVG